MLYRICGILFAVFFIGCDFREYEEEDMGIELAFISSISDDRPADVVIGALGSHSNSCVKPAAKVSVNRDGNIIYLTGTHETYTHFGGGGSCFDSITYSYGEVTVKNLEVGEYIVFSYYGTSYYERNYYELARFRIESDAAYMYVKTSYNSNNPQHNELDVILSPIVPDTGELDDTSYQVKIGVYIAEYFINPEYALEKDKNPDCLPIYKTYIECRQDVINIDIWRIVVDTDTGCTINRSSLGPEGSYFAKTEIDIGTLSTGKYTLFINGHEHLLDVHSKNDTSSTPEPKHPLL